EPLLLEANDTAMGPPFLIFRRCEGQAPGDWRGFHEPRSDSTIQAVAHLAEVLAQLHRLDPAKVGWEIDLGSSTEARLLREVDYRYAKWKHDALRPFPAIDCGFERLRREGRAGGLGPTVLVHGDVLPHNLLVEQGRITALLDWEFVHLGD